MAGSAAARAVLISSATDLSLKTTSRPSQTLLSHHLLIRPLLAAVAPKKHTAISCLISGFDGG
ncbi:hypothetical protein CASFOL_014416 [Castilleja foliolosa]|uniref:Uncharacterized protein n=1 Tax=Castilleja foliolosa TaxID=1961234 RepID=A0ABD3DRW7_9LAMI